MNTIKYLAVCPNDRQDIQDLPDFSRKYTSRAGLTNQLFGITNSIIVALNHSCNIVIIDSFLTCINTGILMPIGRVLDLPATSKRLSELFHFPLYILDRSDITISLKSAEYGLRGLNKIVDVTDKLRPFCNSDGIDIPAGTNFNTLFGIDPIYGFPKRLYLTLQLGNYVISVEHWENPGQILYV